RRGAEAAMARMPGVRGRGAALAALLVALSCGLAAGRPAAGAFLGRLRRFELVEPSFAGRPVLSTRARGDVSGVPLHDAAVTLLLGKPFGRAFNVSLTLAESLFHPGFAFERHDGSGAV